MDTKKAVHAECETISRGGPREKMISCGGVWVVNSETELIQAINTYLENSQLHRDGGQTTIMQQIYTADGLAGKRIGEHVASLVVDASEL